MRLSLWLIVMVGLLCGQDDRLAMARRANANGEPEKAARIWKDLAGQGNGEAQCSLAMVYLNGRGVAKNFEEARRWFEIAADRGYACAFAGLGYIYYVGKSVPLNTVEAFKWYTLASQAGSGPEMAEVISWQLTTAEIAEARQLLKEWLSKHRIVNTPRTPERFRRGGR